MRLIIATKNKSKFKEIKAILKGINITLVSLTQLKKKISIRENGITFLENAFKKARLVSKVYKDDYVVGEDSGLVVDCLEGAPGVFSKRYSGSKATDIKNNRKLLGKLKDVRGKQRRAYFCCCLALAKNGRLIKKFEGKVTGLINYTPEGKGGFGYDPVFYLPRRRKTMAQLLPVEKNKISHRARAFFKLKKYLQKLTV